MNDERLQDHLISLLSGHGAHINFSAAVSEFPRNLMGARVEKIPHTAWHLVYHLWIVQWDIVEFSRDPSHVSPAYPHGYWPDEDAPPDPRTFDQTIQRFEKELESMTAMVRDPANDLYAAIAHGSGQTLLREALVLADHNSYHVGQFVDLRMLLGVPVQDW